MQGASSRNGTGPAAERPARPAAAPAADAEISSDASPDTSLGHTLPEVLEARAALHPDRTLFTFLAAGEAETARLSFGGLAALAARGAAGLRARGVGPGSRVLLVHPEGLDFAGGFLATLRAGATAVPAPGAAPGRANRARLLAIAEDCRPALVLTTSAFLEEARAALGTTPVATLDALEAEGGAAGPMPDPASVALIQYTSGSTGTPRGVVVTHAAIMANQALIKGRFGHTPATVTVGWLPLFHDMGLIGNLLQPLYTGSRCVLMPPGAFLAEPARWLRAIHLYRGTTAGAPNFAYDLCVDRVTPAQAEGLDLSSWTVAYNGSEPVRAETLARFAERFAPQGFRPEAAYPCYGMAEATLFISGVDPAAPPRLREAPDGRLLVGCGRTGPGHAVLAVDPTTLKPRADGRVGELVFQGPSLASGYWERPEDTARTFGARVPGREGTWLRTGDLGLMDGGEVFVTGRIKDVLIVRGRNHYPQDIEATVAAAHPSLRAHGAAAFLVPRAPGSDREVLAVVQEVRRDAMRALDPEAVARAVRAAVSREHGLQVAALALLRPGGLPRTSSGKVRRRPCRAQWLDGRLPVLAESLLGYARPLPHLTPAQAPVQPQAPTPELASQEGPPP